ncbi:glycosyltransferase family 4 protein [Parafilimonas sp.]|uniref:glycosyltransferase family 4 protein n=1 Tax=Parafilimonas sp. TaxID=1969739 RepID=UPI0039E63E56
MYKIVQVVPALGWGGAQVFCIQLCNALAKKDGYEVTLISMYHHNPQKHLPLSMLDEKVKFITLGKKPGIDPGMFLKICQTLKNIRPNVVHTHLHAGYYCFYAYLQLTYPYKKIHTLHNLAKKDAPLHGRKMFKYFFKRNIIEAVTISEEVHASAVKEYGACVKTRIPNGSDKIKPTAALKETTEKINSLKKNSSTKVLLNVARITRQKNQQLLLDVMRHVTNENVIAVVLGDYVTGDKAIYDALIAGKPSNVHFLGKVANVSDYYLNADAFVLTSVFEGMPISLLEALSAGVIPVCTPVGGIISIVTKDTGFLSDDISEASFYKALRLYLDSDEASIQTLKNNGKQLYNKEYSMHSCADKYDALYHSV